MLDQNTVITIDDFNVLVTDQVNARILVSK